MDRKKANNICTEFYSRALSVASHAGGKMTSVLKVFILEKTSLSTWQHEWSSFNDEPSYSLLHLFTAQKNFSSWDASLRPAPTLTRPASVVTVVFVGWLRKIKPHHEQFKKGATDIRHEIGWWILPIKGATVSSSYVFKNTSSKQHINLKPKSDMVSPPEARRWREVRTRKSMSNTHPTK